MGRYCGRLNNTEECGVSENTVQSFHMTYVYIMGKMLNPG